MPKPLIETIDINCPPNEVFAFVSNFLNDAQWRSEVKGIRFLEDGGARLGQRTIEDAAILGSRLATTSIITEWEPGRRLKVISQEGPTPVIVERTCIPIPGGARMTYQMEVDVSKTFFFRLFLPIVGRYYQNKVRGNLKRLKRIMEER